MKFKYKKQNKNGEVVEGIKEAPDKFIVAKEIRAATTHKELLAVIEKHNIQ